MIFSNIFKGVKERHINKTFNSIKIFRSCERNFPIEDLSMNDAKEHILQFAHLYPTLKIPLPVFICD